MVTLNISHIGTITKEYIMSDEEFINDAITSDDAGLGGSAGDAIITEPDEAVESDESTEEVSEAVEVQAETTEELKEEIQEAIEDGASEEEVKEMIEEFTLKVNGKEKTVTLDWNDKADIVRRLQMAEAGQSAMHGKRELEKAYESEIGRLKRNPWEVLEELGLNPDEMSEQRIRARVDEMKKSPEQRQHEQLQRDLEDARAKLKEQEDEAESARFQQLQQEEASKLETEIHSALDAHTTLPRSPKTVQRVADAMLWAMDNGYENVSAEDVIPSVQDEIKNELNQFMKDLPIELMEEFIGKQSLEKFRKSRLNNIQTSTLSEVKATTKASEQKAEKDAKPRRKQKSKDFFKNLGS